MVIYRGRATYARVSGRGFYGIAHRLVDKMGDLVEGIGDEVLLFGAFLAFTACIVIVVNLWQGRTGHSDRQDRAPQGKNDS